MNNLWCYYCDMQAVLDVRVAIIAAIGEDGITRWVD